MKKAGDPADLTSHLGFWLRYVSNHVSAAFADKIAGKDITVAEWVLLRTLYAGAAQPSTLANDLRLTRGAITKLANPLIEKTLVQREANLADGRAQTLSLTSKGRKLIPELAALADLNDQQFFGHLSNSERTHLVQTLKLIVKHNDLKTIPLE
jgi:DNA-binding MarR family transcriptional regulator